MTPIAQNDRLVIQGIITNTLRVPQQGIKVELYEKIIGNDLRLNEAITDEEGFYQIDYQQNQTFHGANELPDVFIKVYSENKWVASSVVHCQKEAGMTINMEVRFGEKEPSVYNKIFNQLNPQLVGMNLTDFTPNDLLKLVGDSKFDLTVSYDFVNARKLKKTLGIREDFLFALMQEGFSSDINELVNTSPDKMRESLEHAIGRNVISVDSAQQLTIIDNFLRLLELLKPSYPFTEEPASVRAHYKIGRSINLLGTTNEKAIRILDLWFRFVMTNNAEAFERDIRDILDTLEAGWFFSFWTGYDFLDIVLDSEKDQRFPIQNFWNLGDRSMEDWGHTFYIDNSPTSSSEIFYKGSELLKEKISLAPTHYLINSLRNVPEYKLQMAIKWLRQNPKFDFRFVTASTHLSSHPTSVDGFDIAKLETELARMQDAFLNGQSNPLLVKTLIQTDYDQPKFVKGKAAIEYIQLVKNAQNTLEYPDAKKIWMESGFVSESYESILEDSVFTSLYDWSIFYTVSGKVLSPASKPLANLKVAAFHTSPEREVRLGETTTSAKGNFKIDYSLRQLHQFVSKEPQLLLRVYKSAKETILLTKSAVIQNASHSEKLTIIADPKFVTGKSEFEILSKVLPYDKDVSIEDHFLWAQVIAEFIGPAVKDSALNSLDTLYWKELFYGLLRSCDDYDPVLLINKSADEQTNLISSAVENKLIHPLFLEHIDETPVNLEALREVVLNLPVSVPKANRSHLGYTLLLSGLSVGDQKAAYDVFLQQLENNASESEALDSILRNFGSYSPNIRAAFEFVEFIGFNPQERYLINSFGVNTVFELSKLSFSQWLELFESVNPGASKEEKLSFILSSQKWFYSFIKANIASQYFAHHLSIKKEFTLNQAVRFLKQYPNFLLGKDHLDTYLDTDSFSLDSTYNLSLLKKEMYQLQRVFNLAEGNPILAEGLLMSKMDTAEKVKRASQGTTLSASQKDAIKRHVLLHYAELLELFEISDLFHLESYSFLDESLFEQLVTRAANQYTYLINLIGYYNDLNNFTGLDVPVKGEALPQLEDLFGSLNYTNCNHCHSVLSPAAYLVDLLNFLKEIEHDRDDNLSALDQFFLRRPDIKMLGLTCENTNNTVPQLQLVNEVLEGAAITTAFKNAEGDGFLKIHGKIFKGVANQEIVKDITIEALTGDSRYGQVVASNSTLGEAPFELLIDPVDAGKNTGDVYPEIFLRAYQNDRLIYISDNPDLHDIKGGILEKNLDIDKKSINEYNESTSYWLRGSIRNSLSNEVISGLVVEAWEKDSKKDDFLGLCQTSAQGEYIIRFDETDYKEHPKEKYPKVYFKVYDGNELILNTRKEKTAQTFQDNIFQKDFEIEPKPKANSKLQPFDVSNIIHQTVYPWSFPADLNAEELNLLLSAAKIDSTRVIQTLHPIKGMEDLLAFNTFGLTNFDTSILFNSANSLGIELHHHYGMHDDTWVKKRVKKVEDLLDKTNLSLEDLTKLLSTQFVNPLQKDILLDATGDGNTIQGTISFGNKELDRLHRFARLKNKTDWTFKELDQLLRVLKAKDINITLVKQLSSVKVIQSRLEISVLKLHSLLGAIDVKTYLDLPSDYDSLFDHIDGRADGFKYDPINGDLSDVRMSFYLKNHELNKDATLSIIQAFEISEGDLKYLIDQELSSDKINLKSLSQLYRTIILAQSLHLEFKELTSLKRIVQLDLSKPLSLESILELIEVHDEIACSGFSIFETEYLLNIGYSGEFTIPNTRITTILSSLLEELKRMIAASSSTEQNETELLDIKKNVTINVISQELEIDRSLTEQILLSQLSGFNESIIQLLVSDELLGQEVNPENFPKLYKSFRWISKVVNVATRWNINDRDFRLFIKLSDTLETFNLLQLPIEDVTTKRIHQWIRLIKINRLQKQYSTDQTILDFVDQKILVPLSEDQERASDKDWKQSLAVQVQSQFNWSIEVVHYVLNRLDQFELSIMGIDWMKKVEDIHQLCNEYFNISEMDSFLESMLTPSVASIKRIRILLKSKLIGQNLDRIEPEMDNQLLERKRDILRDYLLAHNNEFNDVHDIYNYYLIDPEMSSCAETSRVKQAISSIQMFVQRISLSLEKHVSLSYDNVREWTWRKNYRVWEANRKVFLFPENWLMPELRKNKTPFYGEFLDELQQSPINDQTINNLYEKYLSKLHRIANLEVAGIYNDHNHNDHYVFARTREIPHKYYYTKQVSDKYWTPWSHIDVDIQGDHLIPAKQNERLMLIWPQFSEKAREVTKHKVADDGNGIYDVNKPIKFHEIELGYTSLENGRWTAKKQSVVKLEGKEDLPVSGYHLDLDETSLLRITIGTTSYDSSVNLLRKQSFGNLSMSSRGEVNKKQNAIEEESSIYPNNKGATLINNKFVQDTSNTTLIENYQDEYGSPRTTKILDMSNRKFQTLYGSLSGFRMSDAFIYDDDKHTFHINTFDSGGFTKRKYKFQLFYHPFSKLFIKVNNQFGIEGLLNPQSIDTSNLDSDFSKQLTKLRRQQIVNEAFDFAQEYQPSATNVEPQFPIEEIDFSATGVYNEYNWELFFHLPLTLALEFSKNKQFEQAQKWFHYIFDPTEPKDRFSRRRPSDSITQLRFWKIKPFYNFDGLASISDLLKLLHRNDDSLSDSEKQQKEDLLTQLELWEDNPFDPHVIARFRVVSYMKLIVMKYLDNLIAWADNLFTMDTMESINEATQLYVLAQEILGNKPMAVDRPNNYSMTVQEALENSGKFSNALADIEAQFPISSKARMSPIRDTSENVNVIDSFSHIYFCIPANQQLLEYWDTIEDRLFKIRHCMNIEGIKRSLALFQPPIDPSMLVRAVAQGLDLATVLNEPAVAMSPYKFSFIVQKASEMVNVVKSLGSSLLAALEKQDAEAIALIRAGQELDVLDSMRLMKKKAIEESIKNKESLNLTKQLSSKRETYYRSRAYMNPNEESHLEKLGESRYQQKTAQGYELIAGTLAVLPNWSVGINGTFGSPSIVAQIGGTALAAAMRAYGQYLSREASNFSNEASIASTKGSYDRRQDDWTFQAAQAKDEQEQIQKQVDAAETRKQMAEHDLKVHDLQVENAQKNEEFLVRKYTNKELYQWMIKETSRVYFQSYQLAYQIAKKAEKAYEYELGTEDPGIIKFGYWDSLKKGLLSAEKLELDLKRLESQYFDHNERHMELTKHVSLGQLYPHELLRFKETGSCDFALPEVLFDMDHPGHYFRRIKSVSLTIPCITGSYTNINCELTLNRSHYRKLGEVDPNNLDQYPWDGSIEDTRFHHGGPSGTIATSTGQNDSGVFELNFRDDRYLPFEGAGAISQWHLALPSSYRQFDYDSISDVIIHVNYSAKKGSSMLRDAAQLSITNQFNKLSNYFSESSESIKIFLDLKNSFSHAYHELLSISTNETTTETEFEVTQYYLPFFLKDRQAKLKGLTILIKTKSNTTLKDVKATISVVGKNWPTLQKFTTYEKNIKQAYFKSTQLVVNKWQIKLSGPGVNKLKEEMIESFVIIGDYTVS